MYIRTMQGLPDVFDYLDARAYLRDYYAAKKAAQSTFSFRAFSRRAGLKAPNHLKRVMEGERNLAAETVVQYCTALGLSGERAAYFADLVAFTQSRTTAAKEKAYQKLTSFRGYRKAHRLDLAHEAYHSQWFIPAVYELVLRKDFQADPLWIANRMLPRITPKDASAALRVLRELGLIEENAEGRTVQSQAVLTTGPEVAGLHVARYHQEMLARAAQSIDVVPAEQRDISSLTMCMGEGGLERLKQHIQRMRKELIALATEEQDGEQVVQVNIQLFPLSTRRGDER